MHSGGRSCSAIVILALALGACSSHAPSMPSSDAAVDAPADTPSIDAPPDADCSCAIAPPARCLDATTLLSSRAPGTCKAGVCEFETFPSRCSFGCAAGACQAQACTPSCPAAICVDDGCGGTCGPCAIDPTFPGVAPVPLGIARELRMAADGVHILTMRALEPACVGSPTKGTLDVWTVPATGAASHRTIGIHAPLFAATFTDGGYLVYNDGVDPCASSGDLWVARADGSAPVQIARNVALNATVAGRWAYYSAPDPDDARPVPDALLQVARIPDGAPRLVTRLPPGSSQGVSPTGDAVWVTRTTPEPNLILFRVDGAFFVLVATPIEITGTPQWSPDGKRVVYATFDHRTSKISLHAVDVASDDPVVLDDDCPCGGFASVAFSPDGARVAWIDGPSVGFTRDAVIHTFTGGADVRLTDVVSPTAGGTVSSLAFSVDGSRLLAVVNDMSTGLRLMTGRVAASDTAASLGSLRFGASWEESRDGAVIAISSADGTTRVVTYGAGTQSIAGIPLEHARFEHIAASPRLLVQQDAALAVFPTSGAGPGIPVPGFDSTNELSGWANIGQVPFVFGWSGPVALFPSAVNGSTAFVVVQDLMAWTPAATGRLAARVIGYRLDDNLGRVFLITQDQGLFMVPRPIP